MQLCALIQFGITESGRLSCFREDLSHHTLSDWTAAPPFVRLPPSLLWREAKSEPSRLLKYKKSAFMVSFGLNPSTGSKGAPNVTTMDRRAARCGAYQRRSWWGWTRSVRIRNQGCAWRFVAPCIAQRLAVGAILRTTSRFSSLQPGSFIK